MWSAMAFRANARCSKAAAVLPVLPRARQTHKVARCRIPHAQVGRSLAAALAQHCAREMAFLLQPPSERDVKMPTHSPSRNR
jgi:hypothetical protein